MMTPRIVFVAVLLLAPITIGGYVQLRLNRHARSPRSAASSYGFRGWRPEDYTADGQVWLRRLQLWALLLIPYWLLVLLIVRRQ
jgi:hypothetical protein